MPTTLTINTTYAGEFAGKYYMGALLQGVTLGNNTITVKQNVKTKEVLKPMTMSGIIGAQACDFTPTGTIALTERILEPVAMQVNLKLCKEPFRNDWEAVSMGYSQWDTLPKNFADFLLAKISASVAADMESKIWEGTAGAGSFNGFVALLQAEGAAFPVAQEVTGTTVTSANVVAELDKVLAAVPARLRFNPDLTIYASPVVYDAYIRALGGFATLGANGYQGNGTMWYNGQPLTFGGVKLVLANGLTGSKAICTYAENLNFGTGVLNDTNTVKIIDQADIDGSDNVNIVMKFTGAVQIAIPTDCVTYGVVIAGN